MLGHPALIDLNFMDRQLIMDALGWSYQEGECRIVLGQHLVSLISHTPSQYSKKRLKNTSIRLKMDNNILYNSDNTEIHHISETYSTYRFKYYSLWITNKTAQFPKFYIHIELPIVAN